MADLHLDFIDYKKVFKNREKRLKLINKLSFIPDELYIKLVYFIKVGKRLNLKNPQTFSEKINWLKLNDKHPEYSKYVDKYEFKKIVSEKIGPEHVFKLLGVWDKFEDINFDALPDKFVLKCTHDSGSIKIIRNKNEVNKQEFNKFFTGRLSINQYNLSREYPYKDVKPRIIAEELHETDEGQIISDYRIYCFDGEPKVGYVLSGRYQNEVENWFDMDFNPLDIIDPTTPNKAFVVEKPSCFNQMIEVARILSKDIKFVRVDFYEDKGQYYLGEMTFFSHGGFTEFQPINWNYKLGELIIVSNDKR